MPLSERALGRLAAGCECRHQDIVEALAVGDFLLERLGTGAQRFVGELFQLLLERVDVGDARLIGPDPPFVGGTEQLASQRADHVVRSFKFSLLRR